MMIKEFFKRVISIFSRNDIENAFGIKLTGSEMDSAVAKWLRMYTDKSGLRLPAAVASETARLVTLEMKSEITGSQRADYLSQYYNNILGKLRNTTEYACALGGIIFKPYVTINGMHIDITRADSFIPVSFDDDGCMTGVVFVERVREAKKIYTRLEYHELKSKIYTVKNKAFVSYDENTLGREIPLSSVSAWALLEAEQIIYNIEKPLFAYFKMPMANCIDINSPLGISVFEKAAKQIDDVNEQYKRLKWEFESGERFVGMASTAIRHDKDGKPIIPKGDERLIKLFEWDEPDRGGGIFEEWSPQMREQNYINGIQTMLRLVEYNSALAYGTLSNPDTVEKTAEEVKASKQRSYSHVCDIQKELQKSLEHLIWIMNTYADLYNLAPKGNYETSFDWDDSIVADRKAQFAEYTELISLGAAKPWELRMWYFGETEEAAREKCNAVDISEE